MPQKDKKKAVATCVRSDRKEIFVEKKFVFHFRFSFFIFKNSHFLGEQN